MENEHYDDDPYIIQGQDIADFAGALYNSYYWNHGSLSQIIFYKSFFNCCKSNNNVCTSCFTNTNIIVSTRPAPTSQPSRVPTSGPTFSLVPTTAVPTTSLQLLIIYYLIFN